MSRKRLDVIVVSLDVILVTQDQISISLHHVPIALDFIGIRALDDAVLVPNYHIVFVRYVTIAIVCGEGLYHIRFLGSHLPLTTKALERRLCKHFPIEWHSKIFLGRQFHFWSLILLEG